MSDYRVISAVSEALRQILFDAFQADAVTQQIVGNLNDIVFMNPTQTARDTANRLSIWLYQITENEFVKNAPMGRAQNPDLQRFPPMALNLHFLITPFATSGQNDNELNDHMLLGKTLQTLYDNAVVLLSDGGNIVEELRVIFTRMTLEELTRVWDALREPYRLSVCYIVRVTRVDSLREPGGARVIELNEGFGSLPQGGGS